MNSFCCPCLCARHMPGARQGKKMPDRGGRETTRRERPRPAKICSTTGCTAVFKCFRDSVSTLFPVAKHQVPRGLTTASYDNKQKCTARNDTNHPTLRQVSGHLSGADATPQTPLRIRRGSRVGSRHFPCCDAFPVRSVVRKNASNFIGGRSAPLPLGGKEVVLLGTASFRRVL